ncbi:MAG: redoxin domain-containing protein, partial [Ktedonobacterales bacterium]
MSTPDSSSVSSAAQPEQASATSSAAPISPLANWRALWGRYIDRRVASWLTTIALLAAIGLGVLAYNGVANALTRPANTRPAALQGDTLGGVPAPQIALHDQSGALVSLNQFQGHPIVLTFIDSQCPHAECPLTAAGLRSTAQLLGKDASKVVWLALSMNPTDTPTTANAFIKNNNIAFPLHFLLGPQQQLAPLWAA